MKSNQRPIYLLLTGIPVAFLILFIVASFKEPLLVGLCQEDGLVEWGQILFLLLTGISAFTFFARRKDIPFPWRFFSLLFGVFCLFILLEEISYGQRIFRLQSPYYFLRENVHREINFHNLIYFDSASEMTTTLIFILWSILLPFILLWAKKIKNAADERGIFIPTAAIALVCLGGLLAELWCRMRSATYWANNNEILEIFLYYSFFAAALFAVIEHKTEIPNKSQGTE